MIIFAKQHPWIFSINPEETFYGSIKGPIYNNVYNCQYCHSKVYHGISVENNAVLKNMRHWTWYAKTTNDLSFFFFL